ncbi:MAG: isoprenylcysteine carboxylmethyltransferase family protein [Pseudomonadota bacterium]
MLSVIFQNAVPVALLGAVIFGAAGTLAYPGGWAFVVLLFGGGVWLSLWLMKRDPELLKKRLGSPIQRGQKPWDRVFLLTFIAVFVAWLAFMSWDARQHGFIYPLWAQALGALGFSGGIFGGYLTFRENSFAAPVVKMQEGQKVIDTGVYAYVRHPMYAGALLYLIGTPLLLGSWRGLIVTPFLVLAIAWRAVNEEKMLRAELPGYDAYTARVRYRLVPGVW